MKPCVAASACNRVATARAKTRGSGLSNGVASWTSGRPRKSTSASSSQPGCGVAPIAQPPRPDTASGTIGRPRACASGDSSSSIRSSASSDWVSRVIVAPFMPSACASRVRDAVPSIRNCIRTRRCGSLNGICGRRGRNMVAVYICGMSNK